MDNCFISTAKLLAKSSLVAKDPNAQYVADALTDAIADSQYIKGNNLLKTRVVSFINNSIWGKDKFFLDWLNFKSGLVKDVISPDKILYYGDTQSGITAINTFKSWASKFAKYISQDINITATANFNKDIHYFGSKKAYDEGLDFAAHNLVANYFDKYRQNRDISSQDNQNIAWLETKFDILRKFLEVYEYYANNGIIKISEEDKQELVNRNKALNRAKAVNKNTKDFASNTISNLKTDRTALRFKQNGLDKESDKYKQIQAQIDDINKQIKEYQDTINYSVTNKYNSYFNILAPMVQKAYDALSFTGELYKLKNFGALAYNLVIRGDDLRKDILDLPIMTNLRHNFEDIDENDKIFAQDGGDESAGNPVARNNDKDESSRNWENNIAADYKQLYGGKLYAYFASFPRLDSVNPIQRKDKSTVPDYSSDTELGTPSYYSPIELINAITAFCPTTSVDKFISAVENLAQRSAYHGLIKLVNDMRADRRFANYIKSCFASNIVNKTMVQINEDGTRVLRTNVAADVRSQLYLTLTNSAREVYAVAIDENDSNKITEFKNILNSVNTTESFSTNFASDINAMNDFVQKYMHKYFPDINNELIEKFLYSAPNKYTLLKKIFDTLETFDKAAKEIKKNRDIEDERFKQARAKAYIRSLNPETGLYESNLRKGVEVPQYNFDALGFDSFREPINKLVNIFAEAVNADVQLNSRTANNNMASDLIKNSYLTDFFKTLKYIEENEVIDKKGNTTKVVSYRGAEILKNFFTKNNENSGFAGNDMRFSTILWGIKDENGNVLKKGIFNETNGVISINEDVVKAMNYALDNGIRNQNFNKGVEYDSMTSNDYYISTILAFTNPVNYNYNLSKDELKNYAGFLLRVPSDSANNYIVQLPKYKTSDRFNYNSLSVDKVINTYANVFQGENRLSKYTSKIEGFYKDTSAYKRGYQKARPINFTTNIVDILGIIEKDTGTNVKEKTTRVFDTRKYRGWPVTDIAKKEGIEVKEGHKVNLIPIVYNNLETNNGFVIWELVDIDKNGAGSVIEILDTTSLNSSNQSGYGNFADAIISNKDTVGNYLDDGAHITTMDRVYNQNSVVVRAFNQQMLQSFSQMANALQAMLTVDKDGDFIINLDTNGLFDQYHYKGSSPVNKDTHTLTGNIFNLSKLFTINDYNALDELKTILSFYGEGNSIFKVKGDTLAINTDKADSAFIVRGTSKGPIVTLNQNVIANAFSTVVPKWLTAYEQYINQENKKYEELLLNAGIPVGDNIHDAILNQTLINMEFDDLFEGSAAFYKDAQTFLKRAKEIQANGYSYGGAVDSSDEYDATPKIIAEDIILQGEHRREEGKFVDENNNPVRHDKITVLNCFRGVTIHNTHTRYDNVKELHDKLLSVFTEQGVANAKELADELASAFGWGDGDTTTANDAQSYITLDEFIRRKWADGTIGEYGDLLYKLKYGKELTKEEFVTLAKKIQAQKNVYFDKQFDPRTNLHYSRFIKNAEFVLIPQFLAEGSGLKELYNIMMEKNIQQVNTLETSKAANKTVLTFWNPNNELNEDGTTKFYSEEFRKALDDATNIETYYYRSLYKQQDFVDHINDAENKAGVQIMKKILDNASTASPKVQDAVKQIQDNFSANIKADFDALMDACGWEVDENGRIHNVGDDTGSPLNFDVFYERAREEAQRLGLDDNFLSFLEVDDNNNPILPTWMNSASAKLESIAQSIFNNNITRQTLPGFHAAQVSSIGYKTANYVKTSKKLRYYVDDNGTRVIECAVPAWDSNIKKLIAEKGERAALKIINEQGLDKFIGYRIPTEGKQSIGVFKIVEFLDVSQGSTMIVPYEWVTQTGSDFDIDTIYAITYETIGNSKSIKKITKDNLTDDELYSQYFERTLRNIRRQNNNIYDEVAEEYRNLKKTDSVTSEALTDFANRLKDAGLKIKTFDEFNKLSTVEKYSKQQRNNNILDAMITIMNDDSSLEENMSRSNFDGITETKNKKEALLFGENNATTYSVYNPFDQIRFMQNAIDGRKLKAFSVNRDTFNSLNNILKTKLGEKDIIKIRYNLDKYNLQNLIDAYGKENVAVDNTLLDNINEELSNIKKIAISNGTFMKAPNGKDTNLTERQWLQVRTKNFKNWFGDWTKQFVVYQGRKSNKDSRRFNYYTIDKNEASKYGNNLESKTIDTTGMLSYFSNEYTKLRQEFYKKTGKRFDILDNSKEGLQTQNEFFEFVQSEGYTGFELLSEHPHLGKDFIENPYIVEFDNHKDSELISKVVDENGEPLVAYHHTDNPNLTEFSTDFDNYFSKDGGTKEAIFFDENKTGTLDRKYDIPVFLNIRELNEYNETKQQLHDRGTTYRKIINQSSEKNNKDGGVHMKDFDDNKTEHQSIWVVHNPNQIKSATDNSGLFSKTNNNIYDTYSGYRIVNHNRIGNSLNNRNVLGRLLTPYSSQTTAHILDAIKEGALYNETDLTFKVFKTLVDVGTDYDTAISFLMQPAITRINEDYQSSNSIFVNTYNSPVTNVIKRLLKELGVRNGASELDIHTAYSLLPQLCLENEELGQLFHKVWGTSLVINRELANGDEYLDFNVDALSIEEGQLDDRLINSKDNSAERLVFDLGIALLYRKYNRTAQNLEDIAGCTRPDSFGAKQTIHSTRIVLDNIVEFINPDDAHSSTLLVEVDGRDVSVLQALYPDFKRDVDGTYSLDADRSKYKYLAYFLKYATIPSVTANSQLFDTEGPAFTHYVNAFEAKLGRKFTDEEYQDFKKYTVSQIYYACYSLTMPVTLNDKGMIVPDQSASVDENGVMLTDAQQRANEIKRIFGYEETISDEFRFNDIDNPTEEELETYKKLTPLQKVNLIKQQYPIGNGIFGEITTRKGYDNEFNSKGYTYNRLTVNTLKKDMYNFYNDFILAFSNTNPVAKLAALDLIKYAYLVEGGRYRNNRISKIIPTDVLLATTNHFGTNLISEFREKFGSLINTQIDMTAEGTSISDMMDNFIRSHSGLLKNINLPKPNSSNNTQTNIGNTFNDCKVSFTRKDEDGNEHSIDSGLIRIPASGDDYQSLIDVLTQRNDNDIRYIKVGYYNSSNPAAKRQYRLYKVIPYTVNKEIAQPGGEREIEAYYLVPMALMDENEVYDYSQNNKYNTGFYSKEFYTALIKKQFGEEVNLNSYQKIATNKNIKTKEVNKNIILNNYNGDGFAGIVSDKIMDAAFNWDYTTNKITYVYIPGADKYKIAKFLTGNNKFSPVVQTVKANDGKLIDIKIGVSDSKAIASISKKGLVPSDAKEGEVYVLRLNANDHIDVSSTARENTGDDTHTTDTGENETSRFGLVYDELSDELNESKNYDDLTNIAKDVADYIEKESRNPNNILDVDARRQLRQNGVSGETMENILQHRSDIYSVAADLIAAKAKNIIEEINNFKVDDKEYAIDNPELYTALHNSINGPKYAQNLYSLLIRAKAFGSAISDIENVYIAEGENDTIQNSINSIKDSIASVRRNTKINQAIKYVFNTYIAREYSTNPLVQLKVVDLLDAFGDLDWFDNNFADVLHTNNKLIQVIVKLANTELSRAKLDANSKVQQFKKFLNKIKEDLGVDNLDNTFNKLIDEHGKYITAYTKQWEEDKDNLRVAMEDALAKYKEYSVEYQTAKLNRDKWYAENVEQPGVAEYYKLKTQYEEKVLTEAPNEYLRYLELRNKLYNQAENLTELTEEQLNERADWNHEINTIKANNEAIREYIDNIQELNYKYLTQEGNRLWINRKDTMVGIIDKYQNKYPTKEPSELVEMIEEYANAYNWLKANTSYTYNQDIIKQIDKNLSILYGVNEKAENKEPSKYKTTLDAIKDKYRDKTDIAGVLDARLLSEDEIKQLRDATSERYISNDEGTVLDFGLIKNNPWNVIYNPKFKELFGNREPNPKLNEIYTKINSYLIKGVEKTVYHGNITTIVNPILLAKNLTEDELRELYNLYYDLKEATKELRTEDGEPKLDKEYISFTSDKALWQAHKKAIKDSTDKDITKTKKEYILKILNDTTKKGKVIPRYSLYGKMRFTSKGMAEYVDTARSDAKQWINNNIKYVPTKYYKLAFDEAKAKGDEYFNTWYENNHVYNPYTHQVEPLSIWTERIVRPDAINIKNATKDYNPLWFNSDRVFREEYKNGNITPVKEGIAYRSTPTYDNPEYTALNNTEKDLLDQLKQYSDYYAHNYRQRKFVKEGYAPRLYSPEISTKWYAEQLGNMFGFGTRNYSDRQWIDRLEYGKEPPMPFQMYELIKAKGYKKHEILPNRFDYASDEEYNKRLKEVQEYNKQVDIDNAELEKAYINRDWEQVFSTLILQGEEYNAKDNMKDLLFLTLEQLRNQKFYKTSTRYSLNPQVVQDKIKSTIDNVVYKTANSTFGADIFENWMRRYLYSQFHQVNPARKFMDKVQAFTTAKYMMLNLRGGIANVNTGLVNILGEELAGEYFSRNDFVSAEKEYAKSVVGLIGDFINDNGVASNEISAICRWFDIVDTDQMINAPDTKSKVTATKFVGQVNSLLYSFMGTGEHYMQNTALLAMLNSHRVYLDEQTGKYVIGTFDNYIQGVEIKAFRDLISDENSEWHNLMSAFDRYLDAIRKNKNTANQYETLRRDIIADFIKSDYVTPENGNRRNLANAYVKHRKELVDDARKQFETNETVRQQLVYNSETGKEELKAGSNITSRQLAELRDKALYVNKKIHGVYDKMGAAKIEAKWWGSILMQYHKHIYPGYLKRWRRKGYWNETTQSQEKGSRTSFYDLLISSFRTNQSLDTNYSIEGIKSLQAIAMKLQDIFTDFTLNYQMLPIWEQQNIRRNLGDICGILAGILMTMIIYSLWDDDDIKDSKLLNTGLYLADRLYTESRMYNALGAYAEASTQWSQPIAGLSTFKDAFKALNLVSQWIADPVDFNPNYTNTQYKGQNKFGVLLKRNIPIYRVYQRYMNVANNNKYYRINDNNAYQSSAKNVGKYIHDILLPTETRAYGANRRGGSGAVGESVFY